MQTTMKSLQASQRAVCRSGTVGRRALAIRADASGRATKRPQNVQGDFWVDSSCIDCDTCRWMAPFSFTANGGQSAVFRQPETQEERVRAMQALLSCPTFSIHNDGRTREELHLAQEGLPAPIPGVPGMYHCGWHSEASFAAASYLVRRPGGNVLVDSPRYNPVLAKQIEKLGGVKYMFLTHKDDVSDHEKWAKHFKATRILHKGEVRSNTANVEIQLEGEGPWSWSQITSHPNNINKSSEDDGKDLEIILTPGHTSHHTVLYHAPTKTLLSGDHLASPEENDMSDTLAVFKDFNWFDFPTQLNSVQKLLQYDWLHVLPGHGRQAHLRDSMHRLQAVSSLMEQHGRVAVNTPVTVA